MQSVIVFDAYKKGVSMPDTPRIIYTPSATDNMYMVIDKMKAPEIIILGSLHLFYFAM